MRIRTRSIIIMICNALSQSMTLLLGIILVRMVNKQVFGTYRQVMLVYIFLGGIFSLQLQKSFYYYLPKIDLSFRKRLLSQTFLVSFVTSLIIFGIMFFGAGFIAIKFKNPALKGLLRLFSLYPFVDHLILLVPAFMISLDRPLRGSLYTVFNIMSKLIIVISLIYLGFELSAVFGGIVFVCGIIASVCVIDMIRFSPGPWGIDLALLKDQLNYVWPLLTTTIMGVINVQFDKLLISTFFDPETFAVYSCGAMEIPLITLITSSIGSAIMPNMVTMADKGRIDISLKIWQESARKCSLVLFPCAMFFLVIGYDLMVLIYGIDYSLAALPFRIYLVNLLIRIVIYGALLQALGKTKPLAVAALLSLITNIIISSTLVVLGKKGTLSYIGPAIGTECATFVSALFLLFNIAKITKMPFSKVLHWRDLGKVLFIAAISTGIIYIFPLQGIPLIYKLICQTFLYVFTYLSILFVSKTLNHDEIDMILMPVHYIKNVFNVN